MLGEGSKERGEGQFTFSPSPAQERIALRGPDFPETGFDQRRQYVTLRGRVPDFFEHDKIDQFVGSQLWTRYHFRSIEDLHTTNGKKIREGLDMYENLTPDDAPTFFYNSYPNLSSQTRDHLFHSPIHAKILHEKAKKMGVRSILKLDGDNPVNQNPYEEIKKFFIKEISRSKNNILWSIFQ